MSASLSWRITSVFFTTMFVLLESKLATIFWIVGRCGGTISFSFWGGSSLRVRLPFAATLLFVFFLFCNFIPGFFCFLGLREGCQYCLLQQFAILYMCLWFIVLEPIIIDSSSRREMGTISHKGTYILCHCLISELNRNVNDQGDKQEFLEAAVAGT
jgi:hypothetical protein